MRNVFFKSGNLRIVAPLKRFWLLVASERQITLYWTKSVEIFRIFQLLLLTSLLIFSEIFRRTLVLPVVGSHGADQMGDFRCTFSVRTRCL